VSQKTVWYRARLIDFAQCAGSQTQDQSRIFHNGFSALIEHIDSRWQLRQRSERHVFDLANSVTATPE
jgi:hypothetical protein